MKILLAFLFLLLPVFCWSQLDWTFIGSNPQPTTNFTVDECGRYLTSTGHEVYQSEDQGATWTLIEAVTGFDQLSVVDGGINKEAVSENGGFSRYTIECDGSTRVTQSTPRDEEICETMARLRSVTDYSSVRVGDTLFQFEHRPSGMRFPASTHATSATLANGSKISIAYHPNRPIGRYLRLTDTSAQLLVKYSSERDYYDPDRDTLLIPLPQGVADLRYTSYIKANQPDTLVTCWTMNDGSGRTRIARYITNQNEWQYQDLPFTTPVYFRQVGFQILVLVNQEDIYAFGNERKASYELKHTLVNGDSVREYLKNGDEILANGPNDQLAHYTQNGVTRFDRPRFDSKIIELQPLVNGDVLAKNSLGEWYHFEEGNTAAQPANFTQGYTVTSDTLQNFIYEQVRTVSGGSLIVKSGSAVDTLARTGSSTLRIQGQSPSSKVITIGGNYEIANGTLTPLRAELFRQPLGIRGIDTLILRADSFDIYKGNGQVSSVPLGYFQNRLEPFVFTDQHSLFLGSDFFYYPTPHLPSYEILRIDTNTNSLPGGTTGSFYSGFEQVGNSLFTFTRYSQGSLVAKTDLRSPSSDPRFTEISVPTHVYGYDNQICQLPNNIYESPKGRLEGVHAIATSRDGKLYVSGVEGIFFMNSACQNPQILEENYCLSQGDTLILRGLSIVESGVYLDTVQGPGICAFNRITVYEENEVTHSEDSTLCIGDSVLWGNQTHSFDSSGVYILENIQYNSHRDCNTVRVLNVTVPATDTITRDTILPIGSILFGEEITSNGQLVNTYSDLDSDGCDEYVQFTITLTSSAEEPAALARIQLSPNPTTDEVFISGVSNQSAITLQISDATGRVLKRIELQDNSLSLDEFPIGTYYFQFMSAEGSVIRKVIKR